MARTNLAAKTIAPAAANIALITEREGAFTLTKASDVALHDQHVKDAAYNPAPRASGVRVEREKFDTDEQLISFIQANQWNDKKTQFILDNIRKAGRACGMSRLNKLLGRDSKGNPVAVKAE
jgi:hypothetical protein